MTTIRTATARWSLQNGRGIGVAMAFCTAIILRLHNDAQFDVLEFLAIDAYGALGVPPVWFVPL